MTYHILGDSIQFLNVVLEPNEKFIAEAGAMIYMDYGLDYEAKMSTNNKNIFSQIMQGIKRKISGEDIFLVHYKNKISEPQMLGISGPYVGQIEKVNLNNIKNNTLYLQKGAFLAGDYGIEIGIGLTFNIGRGFFGGEGFILQKIKGDTNYNEQNVFFHARGTIIERELDNETILLEPGCLVGYTDGIKFDIETISSIKNMIFDDEGIFLAKLSGTGKVFIQNLPYDKFISQITSEITSNENLLNLFKN